VGLMVKGVGVREGERDRRGAAGSRCRWLRRAHNAVNCPPFQAGIFLCTKRVCVCECVC